MKQKSKNIKKIMTIMALAIGAVILSLAPEAYAAKLRIDDGINPVITIDDNGAGDAVGVLGAISTSITTPEINIIVSTGVTKPLIGSETAPDMHLDGLLTTPFGPGAVTIEFTDTGFVSTSALTGFLSSIGGFAATGADITFATYYDDNNLEFEKTNLISDLGMFSDGAFSSSASSNNVPGGSPFSLTLVASISQKAGSASSFNADLVHTPEPSTFIMLGMGVLGMIGYRKRKSAVKVQ